MKETEYLPTRNDSLAVVWTSMSNSRIKKAERFHLVAERGNYTLCGLRIGPFNIPKKRITEEKQDDSSETEILCKHCERIEKQG